MPTGMRLWQATASWLVAQGQDEKMWGDVLEPQQLTQVKKGGKGRKEGKREHQPVFNSPPTQFHHMPRQLLIHVFLPPSLPQLLWSLAAMGPPVEAEDLFRRLLGAAIARLGSSSTSTSSSTWKGASREVDCQDGDCNPIPVHAIRQLRQVRRKRREGRNEGGREKKQKGGGNACDGGTV